MTEDELRRLLEGNPLVDLLAAERLNPSRVFETTNEDGEKVLFVMREPDPVRLKIPMSFGPPPDLDPMRLSSEVLRCSTSRPATGGRAAMLTKALAIVLGSIAAFSAGLVLRSSRGDR